MTTEATASGRALRPPEQVSTRPVSQFLATWVVAGTMTLTASAGLPGAERERAVSGVALSRIDSGIGAVTTRRWSETPAFRPQTALGRRLWAIRQRIIASGVPLLTDEEIEAEVTARRGDQHHDGA